MSKILFIDEGHGPLTRKYIVDGLTNNGHLVSTYSTHYTGLGPWKEMSTPELISKHQKANFDFIVISTHNGNPNVIKYQRQVKPKYGYIDVEHDLFASYVEVSPRERQLGACAFTQMQHQWLQKRKIPILNARWPKLDIDTSSIPSRVSVSVTNPYENAIVIGTYVVPKQDVTEYSSVFNKIWYKRWVNTDAVWTGTDSLPDDYCATDAIACCSIIAKFWFVVQSSAFVEALLFGCIPILYRSHVVQQTPYSDILTKLTIAKHGAEPTSQITLLAVTADNLAYKINKLRMDSACYQHTLDTLRAEWFTPTQINSPSLVHALQHTINEATRT